jgi:hypothetical protein
MAISRKRKQWIIAIAFLMVMLATIDWLLNDHRLVIPKGNQSKSIVNFKNQ